MDERDNARRLRAAREAKGLSQRQLAERVGFTKGRVQQIEAQADPSKPLTTTDLAMWQALGEAVGLDFAFGMRPASLSYATVAVPESRRALVARVLDMDDDDLEPIDLFLQAWSLASARARKRWATEFRDFLEEEEERRRKESDAAPSLKSRG